MACDRCKGARWICEAHPWKPFPHDACSGPGEACPECVGNRKPPLPDEWVSIASTSDPARSSAATCSRRRDRRGAVRGARACATSGGSPRGHRSIDKAIQWLTAVGVDGLYSACAKVCPAAQREA